MIRVEIAGTPYRIEWEHFIGPAALPPGTDCIIYEGELSKPVWTGNASLHHTDRFCKETGRKVSLAKAIADWPREHRAKVWAAYFNRKGSGIHAKS